MKLVTPVHGATLAELCEKIEANINDGGYEWDGRWQYVNRGYQAVMIKTKLQYSPSRPGPR